jgi:hypothetical protein
MTFRNVLYGLMLLVFMVVIYRCGSDPRRTRLPFGTTDLSSVEAKLAKLPSDERSLVEDYVQRSNGDYIPAQFADPDMPLSARTFAEAIELERDWRQKMRQQQALAAARRAELDARLAPLRALVRAEIVNAEVLTHAQWLQRESPGTTRTPESTEIFVITIRLSNLGDQPVVSLRGALNARDAREYLTMDLCWIETGAERTIPSSSSIEVVCGGRPGVTDQQRAFVAGSPGRFTVEWTPKYIQLADGRAFDVPY